MAKGIYKRSKKAIKHCQTINVGRKPWNKGKKGLQTAWNKGVKGERSHTFGKKNGMWKGAKRSRSYKEKLAGRKASRHCEVCYRVTETHFDHCHEKGHFRGWLCRRCNLTLGMVKDDTVLLENLSQYLKNSYEDTRPKRIFKSLLKIR